MNGLSTRAELNILPLGSYECLIGMDWLDQHHSILDCRNKAFTFLDEEGNPTKVKGIPRESYCQRNINNTAKQMLQEGLPNICSSYGRST
jgi:hypothetical protein